MMIKLIGLIAAVAIGCAAPAAAQNLDAVQVRAEQIEKFLALLNHENPTVRLAAFEEGAKSNDALLRDRAIQAGLESADLQVRNLAIATHLAGDPLILFYLPDGVQLSVEQADKAERLLPVKMDIETNLFDPNSFSARVHRRSQDCQVTSGTVKCLSSHYQIEFGPTIGGAYTGTINGIPMIYRYN